MWAAIPEVPEQRSFIYKRLQLSEFKAQVQVPGKINGMLVSLSEFEVPRYRKTIKTFLKGMLFGDEHCNHSRPYSLAPRGATAASANNPRLGADAR